MTLMQQDGVNLSGLPHTPIVYCVQGLPYIQIADHQLSQTPGLLASEPITPVDSQISNVLPESKLLLSTKTVDLCTLQEDQGRPARADTG